MSAVSLRPASTADLDAICDIDQERIPPGWPRADLADVLANDHWRTMVAERGGDVIGFSLSRQIIDEVELLKIAVSEAFGGQGIGGVLLDELIASAQNERSINLEVRRSNGAAIGLYQSRGFVVVGRRPRYYPDGEEALLMTLELDRPQGDR